MLGKIFWKFLTKSSTGNGIEIGVTVDPTMDLNHVRDEAGHGALEQSVIAKDDIFIGGLRDVILTDNCLKIKLVRYL